MEIVTWTALALGGCIVLAVGAYIISRAASIAHYRTRLEYWRSTIREGKELK